MPFMDIEIEVPQDDCPPFIHRRPRRVRRADEPVIRSYAPQALGLLSLPMFVLVFAVALPFIAAARIREWWEKIVK